MLPEQFQGLGLPDPVVLALAKKYFPPVSLGLRGCNSGNGNDNIRNILVGGRNLQGYFLPRLRTIWRFGDQQHLVQKSLAVLPPFRNRRQASLNFPVSTSTRGGPVPRVLIIDAWLCGTGSGVTDSFPTL